MENQKKDGNSIYNNEERQFSTELKAIQNTIYFKKAVEIQVCDIRKNKHQLLHMVLKKKKKSENPEKQKFKFYLKIIFNI